MSAKRTALHPRSGSHLHSTVTFSVLYRGLLSSAILGGKLWFYEWLWCFQLHLGYPKILRLVGYITRDRRAFCPLMDPDFVKLGPLKRDPAARV